MPHSRAFLTHRSGRSKPSLYPSISFTERINEWSRASTVWHSALRPSLRLSHEQRSPLPCPRILRTSHPYAEEIRSVVDELCQFKTICPCITPRMTAVPPRCDRPEVPTLSMEAACDIFYSLYGDGGRSSTINDLLKRLDFHALSVTLLATTASHNGWDHDRLAKEWEAHRAQVLQTDYNKSLTATIELSLDSPTFHIFPTIPDRKNIFDKFRVLSLAYRSNGFITTLVLVPIRDYLTLQDPRSSPLLRATRDRYLSRFSVDVSPSKPRFEDARWIVSEDVKIEHLLDVFTSNDPGRGDNWNFCYHFLEHLYWHKPRQIMLGSRIEVLPNNHPYKLKCLSELSRVF